MLQLLRYLLFPFSLLFWAVVKLRTAWYSKRGFKSPIPTIVVGNLSTGGTGKTPHAMMVADILLQHGKHPATLSRGYGRKTKGFLEVTTDSKAWEAGDEPLMMKKRYPELPVFVCENRVEGVGTIRELSDTEAKNIDFIILDDAYQHLKLKPDFAIVLLTYDSLHKPWLLLPAGNGREPLSALNRSQCVIVTKCPKNITSHQKEILKNKLKKYTDSPVFFSEYKYLGFVNHLGQTIRPNIARDSAILLAGIANPQYLIHWLKPQFNKLDSVLFSDHYLFTVSELKMVLSKAGTGYIIITEKDRMRIQDVWPEFLENERVLVVPIAPDLGNDSNMFEKFLLAFSSIKELGGSLN